MRLTTKLITIPLILTMLLGINGCKRKEPKREDFNDLRIIETTIPRFGEAKLEDFDGDREVDACYQKDMGTVDYYSSFIAEGHGDYKRSIMKPMTPGLRKSLSDLFQQLKDTGYEIANQNYEEAKKEK